MKAAEYQLAGQSVRGCGREKTRTSYRALPLLCAFWILNNHLQLKRGKSSLEKFQ